MAYLDTSRANAYWVFHREYADAVVSLVHPGNFRVLPPSPRDILLKAEELGLLADKHRWIGLYIR